MLTRVIVITIIFLFIDLYTFKGLHTLAQDWEPITRKVLFYGHWTVFVLFILGSLYISLNISSQSQNTNYKPFFYLFGIMVLIYVPKFVFIGFELIDDLIYLGKWAYAKVGSSSGTENTGEQISRLQFIYQTGAIVAAIPFVSIAYGMIQGRFDFTVRKQKLSFADLPKSFDGLKVVQLSDAHLGSFFEKFERVEEGIQKVNDLNPDVILFTGDLVNNYASEAEPWIPAFKKLKAKYGKFSVLGNHDYGSYGKYASEQEAQANHQRLHEIHEEMGFRLLLNENEKITINNESITILGVENWGVPPFPQKGDVQVAKSNNTSAKDFQILMSHDPSHWDSVVKKEHPDVNITLSGHTHGMQFGVELGNIKWSPVKYKYPKWAGLYQEKDQYLYVNRGFGYIGFPGRVGIKPEVTLLELHSA